MLSEGEHALQILVVEDDPEYASVVTEWLQEQAEGRPLDITVANRLEDAVTFVQQHSPSCVLLDLRLPEASGLKTLLRMQDVAPQVPVVVLTETGDPTMAAKTLRAGAQDYLVKSELDERLLLGLVLSAIERNRHLVRTLDHARRIERGRAELAALDRLGVPDAPEGLRSGVHDHFESLRNRYAKILDQVLYEEAYKVSREHTRKVLRELAAEMAVMGAGPRDIIEVHTSALARLGVGATPERFEAVVEEGRLLVVEIMGYVLDHYRANVLAGESELAT